MYSLQPKCNSYRQRMKRLQKRYRNQIKRPTNTTEDCLILTAKLELLKELLA